jgi:PAP2 superfamily protein
MLTKHRSAMRWAVLLGATMASACVDAPTETAVRAPPASLKAAKFWDVLATTRWNLRATDILQGLPAGTPPNGQAWAGRMLTYLSLAQHRAVLAATAPSNRSTHPSVSAAVARASVVVLREFFATTPGVPDAVERQLVDDQSAPGWPGEKNEDVAAGDAIGRAVGEAVLIQASHDGYLSLAAPTPPVDDGTHWFPTGAIVRSLWGATPFFLEPQDLLLSPDPPAFGSAEFRAGLAEVYAIVSSRTPEQLAIALKWNKVPPNGPFTAGEWNRTADELIRSHHRTEAEAARILAYANVAGFDAQIDCFTTKFNWWVRRPHQADSRIAPLVAFTVPNHPSYPSGHSCISSAMGAVLADAFPSERGMLDGLVAEAGMSRIYAGIHYRFDIEAGQGVGRRAAAKALAGSLE